MPSNGAENGWLPGGVVRSLDQMDIRPIDVFDDAEFGRSYQVWRAAETFERPDAPVLAEPELAIFFRRPDHGERWYAFAAWEGDEMVGVAHAVEPLLDNTTMSFNGVYVEPGRRGHGIGSALVEFLVERTRQSGRTVMLAEASYPFDRREDHPYRRFAEKHGFALANTEVERRLDLPVPDEQLQEWIDEAAEHHQGYSIETFVAPLPERVVAGYCHVTNQLSVDAPTGDIDFEAEGMTPEVLRNREQAMKEAGRTVYHTLALDADGTVVAATTLAVPELDPGRVFQWATLVLREHRGHRLGLAIKAHNLRAVQHDNPDRTAVFTGNSEVNAQMVGINERIGFKPVELLGMFQRKLA